MIDSYLSSIYIRKDKPGKYHKIQIRSMEVEKTNADPFFRSSVQEMLLAILPKVTGTLSFISSSIIIFMILQSEIKLGTPFRRIIFAMCLVDILQSGTSALSTLSSPKGSPGIWGALGNDLTCSIAGFIFQFSSTAASLYMVSLLCHYFFFVQNKVSEGKFRKRIEPILHAVPIGFSLFDALFLLFTGHLNQTDAVCWIASVPYNCIYEADVECIRGEHAYMYRWIFAAAPNGVALALINIISYKMYKIVKQRAKYCSEGEYNNHKKERDFDSNDFHNKAQNKDKDATPPPRNNNLHKSNVNCNIVGARHAGGGGMRRSGTRAAKNNPIFYKEEQDKMNDNSNSSKEFSLPDDQPVSSIPRFRSIINPPRNIDTFENSNFAKDEEDNSSSPLDCNETTSVKKMKLPVRFTNNIDDNEKTEGADRQMRIERLREIKARKILGFRSQEALKQASLYTGSFLTCYFWVYLNGTYEAVAPGEKVPYVLRFCLWFFFPLQGLFNIIIFIRPHVIVLRQNNEKDLSLMEAVWKVVKSGADISKEVVQAKKVKREGVQRRTNVKLIGYDDNRPVHVPQSIRESSVVSKPFTNIGSKFNVSEVSSIHFEYFDDDFNLIDKVDDNVIIELDEDQVMYGDNDFDIYDVDDEGLSYGSNFLDVEEMDGISFAEEAYDDQQTDV